MLWAVLLIPGPFYSIWRRVGVSRNCTLCSLPMVSRDSNAGKLAIQKMNAELGMIAPSAKDDIKVSFGNEKPAEPKVKKPVDPDAW